MRRESVGRRALSWPGPLALAVNADSKRVYVANQYVDTISVIDGLANTAVATVAVGASPSSLAVSLDTGRIYVATTDDAVSVIDGATNSVVATIGVAANP